MGVENGWTKVAKVAKTGRTVIKVPWERDSRDFAKCVASFGHFGHFRFDRQLSSHRRKFHPPHIFSTRREHSLHAPC